MNELDKTKNRGYNTHIYSSAATAEHILSHHGIRGQKWGKQNGPPYPLDAEDHSALEKKKGWRKSLDKNGSDENEHVSEKKSSDRSAKIKKALIIGGGVLATAAAAYGTYKLIKMRREKIERGQDLVNRARAALGDTPLTDIPDAASKTARKISETLDESLRNANPFKSNNDNCTSCSIAGILRTLGFDVTAKDMTSRRTLQEIFEFSGLIPGLRMSEGSAVKFGKSPEDAAEFLLRRFGQNARGTCGIQWKGSRGGHAFSWIIENGKVTFLDFQQALSGDALRRFWDRIDVNGALEYLRLDDKIDNLDWEKLKEFVDVH